MRGIEGEQVLLRVIVSESRVHEGVPLFRRVLETLRAAGLAGATVLKGVGGFGHDRSVHTVDIEVASEGLPVVVEAVDTPERVEAVLGALARLRVMDHGVVMTERAHVIRYAGADGARERQAGREAPGGPAP
jgi:PII-like signaling protein